MNMEEIKEQAIKELDEENFRKAVNEYKQKLKQKTVWDRIFPFRVVFVRKERI